jgi:hypothetical protein
MAAGAEKDALLDLSQHASLARCPEVESVAIPVRVMEVHSGGTKESSTIAAWVIL